MSVAFQLGLPPKILRSREGLAPLLVVPDRLLLAALLTSFRTPVEPHKEITLLVRLAGGWAAVRVHHPLRQERQFRQDGIVPLDDVLL